MSKKRRRRQPTTPGEILKEEFLAPLGMTQKELADHVECDVKVINRLVNGRTSVTAEMALKLGATFRTTAEFWLNAQKAVDLYLAAKRVEKLPKPVLRASSAAKARPRRANKEFGQLDVGVLAQTNGPITLRPAVETA